MRLKYIFSLTLLFCLTCSAFAQSNNKNNSLNFRFATRAESQMLLTDIDSFSNGLNQFDIDLRLQKKNGRKSEWLRLAMNEALNWGDAEKSKVTKAYKAIGANIKKMNLNIPYPKEIILVKTTMKEELNVKVYTRKNWLAISEKDINEASDEDLQLLLTRGLFHLLTRSNTDFKRTTYATIGYTVINHEILLPTDVLTKRISNPNVERRDSYVELNVNGVPTKCVQITYTSKPYTEGNVSDYSSVGFIPLNEDFIPVIKDGQTVILPAAELAAELQQKFGNDTDIMMDPEEVLANRFASLIVLKKQPTDSQLIQRLKTALSLRK